MTQEHSETFDPLLEALIKSCLSPELMRGLDAISSALARSAAIALRKAGELEKDPNFANSAELQSQARLFSLLGGEMGDFIRTTRMLPVQISLRTLEMYQNPNVTVRSIERPVRTKKRAKRTSNPQ